MTKIQKNKLSEKEIQGQILEWLVYNNIWCWKNESVGIYIKERNTYIQKRGKFNIKGVSDILGIYKTKPLAIEVKAENGKLTSEQRKFIDNFNQEGGIAFVAKSVDDVINKLN